MQLNWVYDPNTRISRVDITDNLYYTTNDGGQTIKKYVNGMLEKELHKYGPDLKFTETSWTGSHIDNISMDEWTDEVVWLSDNYSHIVGKLYRHWDKGYLNQNGEIEDVGVHRGMGVISPELPIAVNRICQPASVQEMWDYEKIAEADTSPYEDCRGGGLKWMKHKITGQIYRMGNKLVPYPCCAFPSIHGPWPVDLDDITKHGGKFLSILVAYVGFKKVVGFVFAATTLAYIT